MATYVGTIVYLPTDILEGVEAMLFFYIGHHARTNSLLEMKPDGIFVLIVIILTALSIYAGSMSMVRCYYGYWPINYLAAIGMTLIIYHLSLRLVNNRLLSWCGRVSLVMLCVHIVELTFLPIKTIHERFIMHEYFDVFIHLIFVVGITWALLKLNFVKTLFSIR